MGGGGGSSSKPTARPESKGLVPLPGNTKRPNPRENVLDDAQEHWDKFVGAFGNEDWVWDATDNVRVHDLPTYAGSYTEDRKGKYLEPHRHASPPPREEKHPKGPAPSYPYDPTTRQKPGDAVPLRPNTPKHPPPQVKSPTKPKN